MEPRVVAVAVNGGDGRAGAAPSSIAHCCDVIQDNRSSPASERLAKP